MEAMDAAAAPPVDATAEPLCQRCSESIKLEHQLVRVPYEVLKRSVRSGIRFVEKEFSVVTNTIADAGKKGISRDCVIGTLNSSVKTLSGLKRKLHEMHECEEGDLRRSRARLEYLSGFQKDSNWEKTKVDRLLVDYFLRSSYLSTATKLAETSSIQDLADLRLFEQAQEIIDALKNRSCTKALAWCSENKGKLRKALGFFEFKLRIQEFIELVRQEKSLDALAYARRFLAHFATVEMRRLQEAMTALVLKKTSECSFYKRLLDQNQWENLIEHFKDEFCTLHAMPFPPLLHIYIQAGLSALKTPSCYQETCILDDPFSQPTIRTLAEPLPLAKNTHSKLICYITKELMDEDNPPMVLPNGYAYSAKALQAMSDQNNGIITCPRTNEKFMFASAVRAFVS